MFRQTRILNFSRTQKNLFFDLFGKKEIVTTNNNDKSAKQSEGISSRNNQNDNTNINKVPFVTIKELFSSKNISSIQFDNLKLQAYSIKPPLTITIIYKHYNFESKVEYSAESEEEI